MSSPKLWAGRFSQNTDALVHQFNASLAVDSRLWPYDIAGSIAHVKMLGDCGIIPADEAGIIASGLKKLGHDLECGETVLDAGAEDVHMAVEALLTQRLGPVAGKLHTARSRNDQVATDIRLYVKDAVPEVQRLIIQIQKQIIQLAEESGSAVLAGMTHLQHAQPVRLAHHLLAYFWMLTRDVDRLHDALGRADALPLGAGALAGTTFPIDRHAVAADLGFGSVIENSIDAVSDRDFAIEITSALALVMMHLSRLSEELILWNSMEFGFVVMGDNVTTGSSIMPQKKNPDVAELVRGKAGRVYGDLTALLTLMKSLPLSYNKDMQEDKEPLFDAIDTVSVCLSVLHKLLTNIEFRPGRMLEALHGDFSTATDLADFLVRQGLPFRQAHEVVGKIVGECVNSGVGLESLSAADLVRFDSLFAGADASALVSVAGSSASRESYGGTGNKAVAGQLDRAKEWVELKTRNF